MERATEMVLIDQLDSWCYAIWVLRVRRYTLRVLGNRWLSHGDSIDDGGVKMDRVGKLDVAAVVNLRKSTLDCILRCCIA